MAGGEGALALEPQPQRFREAEVVGARRGRLSGQIRFSETFGKCFVGAGEREGRGVAWAWAGTGPGESISEKLGRNAPRTGDRGGGGRGAGGISVLALRRQSDRSQLGWEGGTASPTTRTRRQHVFCSLTREMLRS